MVLREVNSKTFGTGMLQHAGAAVPVCKVALPSPTGLLSEAIPDRCEGSPECSEIRLGLSYVVEQCCLSEFNCAPDSLIHRIGMALVLVSLRKEQPSKVVIESTLNLSLLVWSERPCEQKAKEAAYQVHSERLLDSRGLAIDALGRCGPIPHSVFGNLVPTHRADAIGPFRDSVDGAINAIEVNLQVFDDPHRLGSLRGGCSSVCKSVAVVHVSREFAALIRTEFCKLMEECGALRLQGCERLVDIDGWHQSLPLTWSK